MLQSASFDEKGVEEGGGGGGGGGGAAVLFRAQELEV